MVISEKQGGMNRWLAISVFDRGYFSILLIILSVCVKSLVLKGCDRAKE